MSEQYDMKRQQRVSFSEEEAERINAALDIMKECTGKDVTPNKFIKASTVSRAKAINEGSGK
ncbi:hypothetical protein HPA02_16660 [Bisbaumannia pacifica]|uniref:Uncharacterized protein n=1 Tax=Bisbaumannia pacifica TaxID=77098 RepID=A0A510X7P7_9GAMM|nr:hypothetical protein [Halomonas pacifica]GEK47383.1 hypothetical protein HPA02_16660 [Halomonas pacifica]